MTVFDAGRELAPHITWGEMVRTGHRSLADRNATESAEHLDALTATAAMLSTVRQHFGAPLIVHSGFRCRALNQAVGGSDYSQHCKGEAADLHIHGVSLRAVFHWIRADSGLPFGQLILEGMQAGQPTWIHLSLGEPWRASDRCRQALSYSPSVGYRMVR